MLNEPVGIIYSLGIAPTVTIPVVYTPLATACCDVVFGVIVFADCVVNCFVDDFVPLLT